MNIIGKIKIKLNKWPKGFLKVAECLLLMGKALGFEKAGVGSAEQSPDRDHTLVSLH